MAITKGAVVVFYDKSFHFRLWNSRCYLFLGSTVWWKSHGLGLRENYCNQYLWCEVIELSCEVEIFTADDMWCSCVIFLGTFSCWHHVNHLARQKSYHSPYICMGLLIRARGTSIVTQGLLCGLWRYGKNQQDKQFQSCRQFNFLSLFRKVCPSWSKGLNVT